MDTINTVIEPLFNNVQSNINVAAPTGILLLGLVTGLRHSMEADHVAAVLSVVASNHKNIKRASMLGAIWGLGHTTSLFIAGLLVLLLAVNISETVSSRLEFGVGIMLLFLGVTTFTGWSIGKFLKACDIKSHHTSTSITIIKAILSILMDMFTMLNTDMHINHSLLAWFMGWREVEHCCLLY